MSEHHIVEIRRSRPKLKDDTFLSTGSSMLNLALTDRVDGGFSPGKYYFLVGDSKSGKTFLSMTCLAEAVRNPAFRKHRLLYDNIEDGMLIDLEHFFGPAVAKRMEPAGGHDEDGDPVFSDTIQDFYFHLDDASERGDPFIYILDSMDGLSSEEEGKKFQEQKKAAKKGKESAGSYGDGKAKVNSAGIRRALQGIRRTGSILIVICQTRENPAAGMFGSKKTRAGGKALQFYATCEIWSNLAGAISKQVKGKSRKLGDKVDLKVKKNRITGKLRNVQVMIYPTYGIDDIGSVVEYLCSEGRLKLDGKKKAALIHECGVDEERWQEIREMAQECWSEIEEACAISRPPRYRR